MHRGGRERRAKGVAAAAAVVGRDENKAINLSSQLNRGHKSSFLVSFTSDSLSQEIVVR